MEVDQGALFDVPSTEVEAVSRGPRRGLKFREPLSFDLIPRLPSDGVPSGHFVCRLAEAVAGLDLTGLLRTYRFKGGYGYEPRHLLAVVVFGMTDGVRDPRDLEEHCRYDARYRYLTGGHVPDECTFERFIERVAPFLEDLLRQLNGQAKVKLNLKLNEVAIDGTKVASNSSWWKYRKESEELPSDPDARLMNSHGRSLVGYNAQIAIDTTTDFIVGADVFSAQADWHLAPEILKCVKDQAGELPACAIADSGYEAPEAIKKVGEMGVDTVFQPRDGLPECLHLNELGDLVCPAGRQLIQISVKPNHGRMLANFRPEGGCRDCSLSKTCPFKGERIQVTEGGDPVEKYHNKARYESEAYKGAMIRRRRVEIPFAQMKFHDGFNRFRRRGLKKVRAEFQLWVISYNIRKLLGAVCALFERIWKASATQLTKKDRPSSVHPSLLQLFASMRFQKAFPCR